MPNKAFLSGDMDGLDPRLNASRPDLADISLKHLVTAERFAEPITYVCTATFTAMFHAPEQEQCSEVLAGENFMALDICDGWAWGWSAHDHYVGYIAAETLTVATAPPTSPPSSDPIDFARQFIGMPYVWGGRGGAGIDCSGLVQRSMAVRGVMAQRDSDMQRETLGVPLANDAPFRRGDILFFPGHVGMMTDEITLIHATRAFGKTVEEALDQVVARVKRKNDGTGIVARKRIAE